MWQAPNWAVPYILQEKIHAEGATAIAWQYKIGGFGSNLYHLGQRVYTESSANCFLKNRSLTISISVYNGKKVYILEMVRDSDSEQNDRRAQSHLPIF